MISAFLLCEYCFRAERGPGRICPRCRYDGVPQNDASSLPEGTAVGAGGRYVLGHQEGRGGFSICYRAWDDRKREIVAVKELFPAEVAERLEDGTVFVEPEYQNDFEAAVHSLCHEGEILRQLTQEPGIVRVGDVFQDNGTAYLPMEFLRGQSYQKYLDDQYSSAQAHLEIKVAVNVAQTILDALGAVHGRGLLHLDVKPANVRVLDDGRIVLLDFGSARDAFRQGSGNYGRTFTPGYAAPEQHDASDVVSQATDVYGLAATLYYSLSLTMPTRADERETGIALVALPTLNPDVPPALDDIVRKAMALAPEDRYPSLGALKTALEPFGTPRGLTIRQLRLPPRHAAPASLRVVAGLLDVTTAILLLATLISAEVISPEQSPLTGILLWWLTQLLPLITGATPGMLVIGLRLTDQSGGRVGSLRLLLRPVMLVLAGVCLRVWPDANGDFMHDRMLGSRVIVKARRS